MINGMFARAIEARSAEELKSVVSEYGITLSSEKASELYSRLSEAMELSDDELEQAAGGCSSVSERYGRLEDTFEKFLEKYGGS